MASVFLAIPTYNEFVHYGTMLGVMAASQEHHYKVACRSSSLLAHGFNHLWCDGVASGCDYFAMCHADISPQAGWLDVLIDEMRAVGADMLSACVPVKTSEGQYSTAMCHPGHAPHYRLNQDDLTKLPVTFSTQDVQGVAGCDGLLCCNTGLWVCKLQQTWNRLVWFNVDTWIDWDNRQPICMPEDWGFSLLLHQLHVPIAATKRVTLSHIGQTHWTANNA
jgi:hypothetical protein